MVLFVVSGWLVTGSVFSASSFKNGFKGYEASFRFGQTPSLGASSAFSPQVSHETAAVMKGHFVYRGHFLHFPFAGRPIPWHSVCYSSWTEMKTWGSLWSLGWHATHVAALLSDGCRPRLGATLHRRRDRE